MIIDICYIRLVLLYGPQESIDNDVSYILIHRQKTSSFLGNMNNVNKVYRAEAHSICAFFLNAVLSIDEDECNHQKLYTYIVSIPFKHVYSVRPKKILT